MILYHVVHIYIIFLQRARGELRHLPAPVPPFPCPRVSLRQQRLRCRGSHLSGGTRPDHGPLPTARSTPLFLSPFLSMIRIGSLGDVPAVRGTHRSRAHRPPLHLKIYHTRRDAEKNWKRIEGSQKTGEKAPKRASGVVVGVPRDIAVLVAACFYRGGEGGVVDVSGQRVLLTRANV